MTFIPLIVNQPTYLTHASLAHFLDPKTSPSLQACQKLINHILEDKQYSFLKISIETDIQIESLQNVCLLRYPEKECISTVYKKLLT